MRSSRSRMHALRSAFAAIARLPEGAVMVSEYMGFVWQGPHDRGDEGSGQDAGARAGRRTRRDGREQGVAGGRTPVWKLWLWSKRSGPTCGGTGNWCVTDSPTRTSQTSHCHAFRPARVGGVCCASDPLSRPPAGFQLYGRQDYYQTTTGGYWLPLRRFPKAVVGHKGMRSGAWLVRL